MVEPVHSAPHTSGALRESCADLIRRLRRGDSARAEQYLQQFPYLAGDDEAAVELIYTEFATREELGLRPNEDEFLARFSKHETALRRQFDIHRLLNETPPSGGTAGSDDATGEAPEMPPRLGAYELLRPLGRGGMGVVYLARHTELGRPAALKILNRPAGDKAALSERFRAEVRSAAALGHPQIVQLYELGETPDGRLFAAFEYVAGGTLQQAIGGRPRPSRAAAELMLRLSEATACAHRAGIVHCDLTPANVLLTPEGVPKIADFGLARLPRATDEGSGKDGLGHDAASDDDASSALAGTPGYLAPERIARPDIATPAVDVYGLGAVFYELLTGRPPLVGATPLETLRRAQHEDPPSPRVVVPSVPRDAATICLKCLARDPERRYRDAAALADDLRRFLAGEPIAARPVGSAERVWKWSQRRPGLTAALVAATVAILVAVVGGAWYNVRLREALARTEAQERQIRNQAGTLTEQLEQVRRNVFTLQLNQAEALVDRAPHQALALLRDETRCPPADRDFAWGLLVARASQDRRTLVDFGGPVRGLAWNGAGELVTSSADDDLARWNIQTGAQLGRYAVAADEARLTTLSPSGTKFAAAFEDHTIRTWELLGSGEGEERELVERELVGHTAPVTALAFFPDGRWTASIDMTGQMLIWDPTGMAIAGWDALETGTATALTVSSDGKTLAVGGSDGVVRLLDAVDGRDRGKFWGHAGGVAAVAFSPDDRRIIAVGVLGGMISVWDRDTKTEATTIDPVGVVRTLAISRDGKRLAFATTEHVVRVVEITSGATLGEYRGHSDRVSALLFAPDGESVLSASDDRTVKVWDVPGRALTVDLPGDDLKSLVVEFSADGTTAATAGYDGIIRLCDAATGAERKRLAGHQGAVRALCFFDDDRRLLSCSEDATVRLWDVVAGVELRKWEHPQWVLDVVVVQDAFLSIANDGVVRRAALAAYDLQEVKTPDRDRRETLDHAAFSADGTRLATATKNDFSLQNLPTGAFYVGFVPSEKNITALKFSPDGQTLAVGDDAGLVTLWRASTQELLLRLRGHSRGVYDLAFSPDGRLIASASGGRWVQASGEVKLWDVASGEVHATVDGGTAPIAFDAQGRRLAVSDDVKRQVRLWTAAPYDAVGGAGR